MTEVSTKQVQQDSKKGFGLQLMATVLVCMQHLISKYMFSRHPDMQPTQLLFLRCTFTALILISIIKPINAKKYMYDSIPRKTFPLLMFHVIQSIIFLICLYTTLKRLPLVYSSLMQNMSPLLTALISYIYLSVKLSKMEIAVLIVSFYQVMMLMGASSSISASQSSIGLDILGVAMLVPIIGASQSICLRQMRCLSEYTIGCYLSISMSILYGSQLLISGEGADFLGKLNVVDYLLCAILGSTSSCIQLLKTKAIKYEEPAKLASLSYLQPVFQLVFDLLIFHTTFSEEQWRGILIIIGLNCLQWVGEISKLYKQKSIKKE